MRPTENIEQMIKKLNDSTSAEMDQRVLDDVLQALEQSKRTITPTRRLIMKSPITKLAAAAVVIIACVIGLSLWRTTGSGIALADVLARMEQVKAYRFTRSLYFWREKVTGKEPKKHYTRATFLISQE